MQQTCPKCGFTAELNAKFCRQCGASLLNESGGSEAQTQHYGRQTPPPVSEPTSSPFTSQMPNQPPTPPSIADTFTPDTAQLRNQATPSYPPPQYGQIQHPAVPPYGPTMGETKPKSNWWKWALGAVLASVLVCGGCVTYGLYRAQEMGQGLSQKIQSAVNEAQRQAEAEAAKQVPPVIGPNGKVIPPPPPAPPAPGESNVSADVAKLKYPNAKEDSHVKAMGQEVLTLTSEASMNEIKSFYQKQLGEPTAETTSESKRTVVFQKSPLMVTLTSSDEDPAITNINIIRSNFIPDFKKMQ